MAHLQERWTKFRHSKWAYFFPFAVFALGTAIAVAQDPLALDYIKDPWDGTSEPSLAEEYLRTVALSWLGVGLIALMVPYYAVVRPQWKPPQAIFHLVPIVVIAVITCGFVGAFVFAPESWTDQSMVGLVERDPFISGIFIAIVLGFCVSPYVYLWTHPPAEKPASGHWRVSVAIVLLVVVSGLQAAGLVLGADYAFEIDNLFPGPEFTGFEHSFLRRGSTFQMVAVLLIIFPTLVFLMYKNRTEQDMHRLASAVPIGFAFGAFAPFVLVPDAWTDQSLQGLAEEPSSLLFIIAIMGILAIVFLTYGARQARKLQAKKASEGETDG